MAAYMIVEIAETMDPEGFDDYQQKVGPILATYGVKRIVMSDQIDVLNGDWEPDRLVVFEFESQERIREWYESEEYQAIIPLRDRSATSRMVSIPAE